MAKTPWSPIAISQAPLPHLSGAFLIAAQAGETEHTPEIQADLAASGAVLQEFLAADTVVIGVAFYNFTIATQLKAWVDRILITGQTFRYGANGVPEGLAGGKRVILAIARGGHYGPDSPTRSYEHAETYLRTVLGFIGIYEPEVISADGLSVGPEQREAALAEAEQQAAALAA